MVDSLSEASAPGVGLVANQHLKQQQLEVGPSMEEKLHEQELQASRPASPVSQLASAILLVSAAPIVAAAAEVVAAFAVEATAAAAVVASAGVAPVAAAEVAVVASSSLAVVAAV